MDFFRKEGRGGQGIRMNTTMPSDSARPRAAPRRSVFMLGAVLAAAGLAAFLVGARGPHPADAWQAYSHQFSPVVGDGPGRGALLGRHPHHQGPLERPAGAGCAEAFAGLFPALLRAVSWFLSRENTSVPLAARRPARQGGLAEHPVPFYPRRRRAADPLRHRLRVSSPGPQAETRRRAPAVRACGGCVAGRAPRDPADADRIQQPHEPAGPASIVSRSPWCSA